MEDVSVPPAVSLLRTIDAALQSGLDWTDADRSSITLGDPIQALLARLRGVSPISLLLWAVIWAAVVGTGYPMSNSPYFRLDSWSLQSTCLGYLFVVSVTTVVIHAYTWQHGALPKLFHELAKRAYPSNEEGLASLTSRLSGFHDQFASSCRSWSRRAAAFACALTALWLAIWLLGFLTFAILAIAGEDPRPSDFATSYEWALLGWAYILALSLVLVFFVYAAFLVVVRQAVAIAWIAKFIKRFDVFVLPGEETAAGGWGFLGTYSLVVTLVPAAFAIWAAYGSLVDRLRLYGTSGLEAGLASDIVGEAWFYAILLVVASMTLCVPIWLAHKAMLGHRNGSLQRIEERLVHLRRATEPALRSNQPPSKELLEEALQYEELYRFTSAQPTWPVQSLRLWLALANVAIPIAVSVLLQVIP